jgi:hypothetical protein
MTEADNKPRFRVRSDPEAIRVIGAALLDGTLPDVYVSDGAVVHIEGISGTAARPSTMIPRCPSAPAF